MYELSGYDATLKHSIHSGPVGSSNLGAANLKGPVSPATPPMTPEALTHMS